MSPIVHPSSLLSLILLLCAWVTMPASSPASPSIHLPAPGFACPPFIFLISAALLWTPALREEQPDFQQAVEALTRLAGPSVLQWLLAGALTRAPACLYVHTCTSVPVPPCLSFYSCTPTSAPAHLHPWHWPQRCRGSPWARLAPVPCPSHASPRPALPAL